MIHRASEDSIHFFETKFENNEPLKMFGFNVEGKRKGLVDYEDDPLENSHDYIRKSVKQL